MDVIKTRGLTLDEFACTAVCNGASIVKHRVMDCGENHLDWENAEKLFRKTVKEVCIQTEKKLVVAYDRSVLLQTGSGHFSPIGGYHEGTDKVLILDVARFKYPPHWVPLKLLVKSMSSIDSDTGLSRGYVVLNKSNMHMSAVLRVNIGRSQWRQFADSYRNTMISRLKKAVSLPSNAGEYLALSCKVISDIHVMDYLVDYVTSFENLAEEHVAYIEQVFKEIETTKILQTMKSFPEACCKAYDKHGYKEVASIFILAQGPIGMELLTPEARDDTQSLFESPLPPELGVEVKALSNTLAALSPGCACQSIGGKDCAKLQPQTSTTNSSHTSTPVNTPAATTTTTTVKATTTKMTTTTTPSCAGKDSGCKPCRKTRP